MTGGDRLAHVVVSGKHAQWTVLDVVEGHVRRMTADEVWRAGLVLRGSRPMSDRAEWYAPLWTRVRPVILKLAAASFLINVLGLATPLFMMLVLNRVIGRGTPDGIVSLMTVLCIGMLVAYGSTSRCAWRAAGCRRAPARGSTR